MFKKLFSFIFISLMMFSSIGCDNKNAGTFEGLDYVTERQICDAYYDMRLVNDEYAKRENVNIYEYYGFHNGYPVIMMHPGGWFAFSRGFVDGIYFFNPNWVWEVFIFKDNTLIDFIEEYYDGLLTRENIRDIQKARFGEDDTPYGMPNLNKRTIWQGNINEAFNEETIMVTVFEEFNNFVFKPKLDRYWENNAGDFKLIHAVSVEKISGEVSYNDLEIQNEYEKYRQVLEVKIMDKGKQNVIDAIRVLEDYDFVQSARPKYFL